MQLNSLKSFNLLTNLFSSLFVLAWRRTRRIYDLQYLHWVISIQRMYLLIKKELWFNNIKAGSECSSYKIFWSPAKYQFNEIYLLVSSKNFLSNLLNSVLFLHWNASILQIFVVKMKLDIAIYFIEWALESNLNTTDYLNREAHYENNSRLHLNNSNLANTYEYMNQISFHHLAPSKCQIFVSIVTTQAWMYQIQFSRIIN